MSADIVERLTRKAKHYGAMCELGCGHAAIEGAWREFEADLRTALAERAAVPEGWRDHVETALKALSAAVSVYDVALADKARAGLRAMLAAAPQPPAERAAVPAQVVALDGNAAIAVLKEALRDMQAIQCTVPESGALLGYFCNRWNAALTAQPAATEGQKP